MHYLPEDSSSTRKLEPPKDPVLLALHRCNNVPGLNHTDSTVLFAMSRYLRGQVKRMGMDLVAHLSGTSTRTAKRSVARLTSLGIVQSAGDGYGGRGDYAERKLTGEVDPWDDFAPSPDNRPRKGVTVDTHNGVMNDTHKGVTDDTPWVSRVAHRQQINNTTDKQQQSNSTTEKQAAAGSAAGSDVVVSCLMNGTGLTPAEATSIAREPSCTLETAQLGVACYHQAVSRGTHIPSPGGWIRVAIREGRQLAPDKKPPQVTREDHLAAIARRTTEEHIEYATKCVEACTMTRDEGFAYLADNRIQVAA